MPDDRKVLLYFLNRKVNNLFDELARYKPHDRLLIHVKVDGRVLEVIRFNHPAPNRVQITPSILTFEFDSRRSRDLDLKGSYG